MVLDKLVGQYSKEETAFFKKYDWTRDTKEISVDSRGGKVFVGREINEDLNFIPDMKTTNYIYDKAFGRVDE